MTPRVTLKLATSLDGRIATATGESRWITGEAARTDGHRLRARHDAILIGGGTARADDPTLDVRLPGYAGPQPLRVVMAGAGELSPTLNLTRTGPRPRIFAGRPTPADVLSALADEGITRVLVEGGGVIAAAFIEADAVDRIVWYRAPILLGGEGRASVAALAFAGLGGAPRFRRLDVAELGPDLRERYQRL